MFEIISTVFDIVIAVIGTIIAVYEFKNEKRAKKEEYAKNVTLKEMVSKIKESSMTYDYLKSIDDIPVYNEDDIFRTSDMYLGFVEGYNKYYSSIKDLYRGLLKFESEFSLSYGFERYIIYFREYLRKTKVGDEKIQEQYRYLKVDIDKEDSTSCIVDCGHLRDLFKDHIPVIKTLDIIIIDELRCKFSLE